MNRAAVSSAILLSLLLLSRLVAAADESALPPLPEKVAGSLSNALRAIRGEKTGQSAPDRILLEDDSIAIVMGPFGKHDAFIFFNHVPCKEAVPILISSLAGYLELKAKGHHLMECTWLHLRGALMAQTGEDFAFDQVAWQAWWDAKGRDMPETFFEENILKRKKANQMPEPTGASAPVAHR